MGLLVRVETLTQEQLRVNEGAFLAIAADVPGEYWTLDNFLVDLPDKWRLSFAVWDREHPVAYAVVSRKGATTAHLHHLMVRAEHRALGLGQRILVEMERRARTAECDTLTLKAVASDERVRAFYERTGFSVEGQDGDYVLMAKRIA